jgi:hypothetical protein
MNYKNLLSPKKIINAIRLESRALQQIVQHGYPDTSLHFLGGLGDEIMLTCIARELRKRDPRKKIWQISSAAELIKNNPDYSLVLDHTYWDLRHSNILKKTRTKLGYSHALPGDDVWEVPTEHILLNSLKKTGIKGSVELRPYVYLTNGEVEKYRFNKFQICFQSVGEDTHGTWMRNKIWSHSNLCEVVDEIKKKIPEIKTIQLGILQDPALPCDIDLRGKTGLRQTAATIAASKLFIGTQGFLPHLARAVDTRSVVIFGGREHAWQSGYIANINLESFPSCSPCWAMSRCSNDRTCMAQISVDDVCSAVLRAIEEVEKPLLVQTEVI